MLQIVFISCFSFFILRQGIFLPPFSLVFFVLLSYYSLYVCSYSIIKITCTLHDFCSCLCQHPRYKIDVALRGTLHQHKSKVNFAIVIKKPLLALFLRLEMCYIAVYINFHPRSELHCFLVSFLLIIIQFIGSEYLLPNCICEWSFGCISDFYGYLMSQYVFDSFVMLSCERSTGPFFKQPAKF